MQFSPYRIPDSRNYEMNQLCKVCGEPAAGFHFGAFTCEGCKSFFGRTCNNISGISDCKNGGRCEITKKNRTSCKQCRLRKCLSVGMSKSGSRYGRRSNWFKIHCLLTAQNQNGGMSPSSESSSNNNLPSTANNNNNTSSASNFPTNHHSILQKSPKSSVISPLGSFSGSSSGGSDARSERNPSSSSSTSQMLASNNGLFPAFSTFPAGLSPESREQFLASFTNLNQKFANPELAEYFRQASVGVAGLNSVVGHSAYPFHHAALGAKMKNFSTEKDFDESEETPKRPRSPDSPNSIVSCGDDNKSTTNSPFSLPFGFPSEFKSSDLSPMDIFMKDQMKMGYDPMQLWSAMIAAAPQNLHQLNPYRFMFPGAFPPGVFPAGTGTPGFPANLSSASALINEGILNSNRLTPTEMTSARSESTSPPCKSPSNKSTNDKKYKESLHVPRKLSLSQNHHTLTTVDDNDAPLCLSAKKRLSPPLSPSSTSSNRSITPPINLNLNFKELREFPISNKSKSQPAQDMPIDLSAKSTNSNMNSPSDQSQNHQRFKSVTAAVSSTPSDSDDDH